MKCISVLAVLFVSTTASKVYAREAPEDALAKKMTHDLERNFDKEILREYYANAKLSFEGEAGGIVGLSGI